MRLDVFLFENGYASSRTEAKQLILESLISVNGKAISKASYDVTDGDEITVADPGVRYASRGGKKLECAIEAFNFDIEGKLAIDVGASSGGFTDCLLKNGASHVIAVDSGTEQLVAALRSDDRVTVMEGYNARYMTPSDLPYAPELAVMDVSFISATYIIPALYSCLKSGADFICLIKPQFEVGRANIGKGGIVKDDKVRAAAVNKVVEFAQSIGFSTVGVVRSSVVGGDGNIEFLAHFKK
jgi:23S rRNA (cytidine1920-2'-O)/16S rRNA (cytidine1409-2'-O)-methyltransferase